MERALQILEIPPELQQRVLLGQRQWGAGDKAVELSSVVMSCYMLLIIVAVYCPLVHSGIRSKVWLDAGKQNYIWSSNVQHIVEPICAFSNLRASKNYKKTWSFLCFRDVSCKYRMVPQMPDFSSFPPVKPRLSMHLFQKFEHDVEAKRSAHRHGLADYHKLSTVIEFHCNTYRYL